MHDPLHEEQQSTEQVFDGKLLHVFRDEVRLPDGRSLKVTAERDVLRDDTVNRLYKQAMLRIRAEYNVLTRELRNARLVEFVEYAPRVDEDDMAQLTRRGAQAWKDVPDATLWVDELRGGGH